MAGVDLAREERLKKGDACIDQLRVVMEDPTMRKIGNKPNEVSNAG